ncbi:MAG TPA: flagellar basal body rod protein FlgB [Accumulibacter sp.]|nr:flagellar basal body rod protein FlgB [Accumulibacter sp.]MDS4056117.1 flagellar basal body rod protein FlgB [Accumulibacter sp.]HMV04000.1 flagellar basal body rod protein FlgB [Accumulibacter sp.]HMW62350.1 flagellar basal body rod protein FlgB [Accumulibacter sp.]HMW78770.1 flagellar basal body rod protein FlgB [Accumulibacter sp.]HNB67598.1 flagellar basal body rod protein FlgB [Accumulibacter sp.]
MLSKLDRALFFQEQALTLRAARQQVLASNIANADTPHYKARDFAFAGALQRALSVRGVDSVRLLTTSPRHLAGNVDAALTPMLYRQPAQASADGNTVEMDVERAQLAENSIFYEAGLTFLSGQLRTLTSALQGQ